MTLNKSICNSFFEIIVLAIILNLTSCSSLNEQYKFMLKEESMNDWEDLSKSDVVNVYYYKKLDLYLWIYITDRKISIGPKYIPIISYYKFLSYVSNFIPVNNCNEIRISIDTPYVIENFNNLLNIQFNNKTVLYKSSNNEAVKGHNFNYIYDTCIDLSYINQIKIEFEDIKNESRTVKIPTLNFKNCLTVVYEDLPFAH